jgi:hypothetical protein
MAEWTITINDPRVNTVIDAFAAEFQYDDHHQPDETKAQFAKRMLRHWVKTITKNQAGISSYKSGVATAAQAQVAAEQDVEDNLQIT